MHDDLDMDYLSVVLQRRGTLLDTVSSTVGNSRTVCPRGRLLALVTAGGVAVYSLTRESHEFIVSSDLFTRSVFVI